MNAVNIIDQAIRDFFSGKTTISDFTEILKPMHDVEPVIRCKDCKHRPIIRDPSKGGSGLEFPDDECPCNCDNSYYAWRPGGNWYCPKGERKDADL